ncbi:CFAP251, partial [Symbiodinium sp. KB8]
SSSSEPQALSLHWTLGINKDVVGGVHNLSDAESSDMFYAAAHTGVIFDYNTGVQRLLQGHVNPISATAVSKDKKWIVTADTGPDSMMVVWGDVYVRAQCRLNRIGHGPLLFWGVDVQGVEFMRRCQPERRGDSVAGGALAWGPGEEEPYGMLRSPTFLVGAERQRKNLDEFKRREQQLAEAYHKNKPLCFNACSYQKTHPVKAQKGHKDADACLTVPLVLGVADGVSQIEDFGIDASMLPNELLQVVEQLGMHQLIPGAKLPSADTYRGPVSMLRRAFEATESLGSLTVVLAVMDNSTRIHGKLHPMIAIITIGDCELIVLRRVKGARQPLEIVCHTEMQRIDGHAQTPLQLARVDARIDPNFHEALTIEVIERGSAVHCVSAYEGDIVIMGSDGVFDNLYLDEIMALANAMLPPTQAGQHFSEAQMKALAQQIVEACHAKTRPGPMGQLREAPIGRGGKKDDTSCVVAEVVEWTKEHARVWATPDDGFGWTSMMNNFFPLNLNGCCVASYDSDDEVDLRKPASKKPTNFQNEMQSGVHNGQWNGIPVAKQAVPVPGPDSTSRTEHGKSQKETGESQDYQTISVWDWPSDNDGPVCTAAVGTQDVQTCVLFNAWDTHEIATNGKRRVFFWTWDVEQPFQFYSPALAPRDFKQRIGDYTQTIFLPESTQAATGTIDGDVVIWDLSLIVDGLSRPDERRAVKIIRLCPDVSLNVLQVHEKARVVIGTADGAVRFYDYQFRVQAWFEDLLAGSVKSISFEKANEDAEDYEPTGISAGVGVEDDFKCPNFLVSTGSALVVLVESKLFYELSPENRRGRLVLQGLDSPVHGLCCHPQLPLVAVCGYSGFLHMWNYNTRSLHLVKIFEKLVPHILQFSPDGKLLAAGFTNGHCKLLKSTDLSEVVSFRDSRDCVTHIAFSSDSCHLALAHADRSLCLYRYSHRPNDKNFPKEWMYSAKHKSHWRPIVGLCFSGSESEKLRLFSVGEDRRLVEYNVKSSEFGGLQIVQPDTVVEQEARPTGCMWYPYSGGKGDNQKVLTMNDEYKFKIWNTVNRSCRKTALAPTYGGPITRMTPVYAEADGEDQFMLYATHEKVLGLVQLPLDGNPNKCMGLIAHPGQIAAISVDYQGQYAFTCGGNDLTVNQWLIDPQPVANASVMGGSGIEPFVKLLDGGEDGAFFCDMKDYFYYSQIRSQDENTTKARALDGMIPVQEIPHLMCALGYFPTQLEITNMTNEVKYSKFAETGEYVERIGFDDLVKLYVNHRPVFAVGPEQIRQAFEATKRHEPGPLSREGFLSLLTSHGEKMSYEELERCFEALVGDSSINRVLEEE